MSFCTTSRISTFKCAHFVDARACGYDPQTSFANRSFCHTFAVAPEHTVGRKLYEIGNGQWDIPKLRTSLETIISDRKTIEAFEVEHFFPSIGRRIMLLKARPVYRAKRRLRGSHVASQPSGTSIQS